MSYEKINHTYDDDDDDDNDDDDDDDDVSAYGTLRELHAYHCGPLCTSCVVQCYFFWHNMIDPPRRQTMHHAWY